VCKLRTLFGKQPFSLLRRLLAAQNPQNSFNGREFSRKRETNLFCIARFTNETRNNGVKNSLMLHAAPTEPFLEWLCGESAPLQFSPHLKWNQIATGTPINNNLVILRHAFDRILSLIRAGNFF